MTEIRFYHLDRQPLEHVLPALLTKAYESGKRILVKVSEEKEAERLADLLWTFHPDSFLPHGTKKDGFENLQPVFLTHSDDNPNDADVLILTGGAQSAHMDRHSLCCEMLDGRDEQAVSAARQRWKDYKEKGFAVTYWQQTEKGWEKKGD